MTFEDAESGEVLEVNTSDPDARAAFAEVAGYRMARLRRLFRTSGLDTIEVQTDQPYLRALMQFFSSRIRRLHP